jgi:hypothetical protein
VDLRHHGTSSFPSAFSGNPATHQHRAPPVKLDTRHAPSYPAHCAGDALGERASAALRRARRKHSGMTDNIVRESSSPCLSQSPCLLYDYPTFIPPPSSFILNVPATSPFSIADRGTRRCRGSRHRSRYPARGRWAGPATAPAVQGWDSGSPPRRSIVRHMPGKGRDDPGFLTV